MKKKTLFPFMGLFIIFLLSSCNNDYDVQRDDATSRVDSNFVSLKNAKSIATTYEFTNLKTRSKIGKKNIASIYSLKKKSGLPEMYVVNYEGGGFLVISADKRVNEILAYSEDSSFPIDDNVEMPEGVASWMDGYAFLVDSKSSLFVLYNFMYSFSLPAKKNFASCKIVIKSSNGNIITSSFP